MLTPSQTSLHFCASKNNLSTARKLLSHGASARIKDQRGQLPLHRAAAIGSVPFLNLLLEHKSPINASDIAGFTALHHSTLFSISSAVNLQVFQPLTAPPNRAHGGTSIASLNFPPRLPCTGKSPLKSKRLAISEGHGDTALALIKAGAETDKKDVDDHLAIDLAPDIKVVFS